MRPRCLRHHHLETFKWLAISRLQDLSGAWCAFCMLFKTSDEGGGRAGISGGSGNQKMVNLVNRPLRNFSDLTGREGCLEAHEKTQFHKACAIRTANCLRCTQPSNGTCNVRTIISEANKVEIEQNRSAQRSIIDTVQVCAIRNIALRGHRDDGPVDPSGNAQIENDGNFRALLRLKLRAGGDIFQKHLKDAPKNAKYTSKTIQNELLTEMATMVLNDVIKETKAAGVWCVLADETTDRAKTEQLAICVRYVSEPTPNSYVIKEEPGAILDFITALQDIIEAEASTELVELDKNENYEEVKMSGSAIAKVIKKHILRLDLEMATLVGQGYDGASAMSSERAGVAANI